MFSILINASFCKKLFLEETQNEMKMFCNICRLTPQNEHEARLWYEEAYAYITYICIFQSYRYLYDGILPME